MTEAEASSFDSCALCGRTILRGERLFEYVSAEGERHGVCALCRKRAESMGWMPEHLADEPVPDPVQASPQPAATETPPREEPEPRPAVPAPPILREERSDAELALEAFNAAEPAHRIAGLMRSLGIPSVAIDEIDRGVRVIVAWELSWYRWEVRMGALGAEIEEVGKGSELQEIDPPPLWNARTEEDGRVTRAEA